MNKTPETKRARKVHTEWLANMGNASAPIFGDIAAGPEPIEPAANSNFVPAKLSHSSPDELPAPPNDLSALIDACDFANGGRGIFLQATEEDEVFLAAYTLYRQILVVGDTAELAARSQPYILQRKRAPNRNNPALLALSLAAKPQTPRQQKRCSTLASRLIHAADIGQPESGFVEFLKSRPLKESKDYVSEKRRAVKAGRAKPAAMVVESVSAPAPVAQGDRLVFRVGDDVRELSLDPELLSALTQKFPASEDRNAFAMAFRAMASILDDPQ